MYLHVHLYLQIKFKISHIFTYNRMLINFDQTRLAKNSSKVIIHSFTHSVVRHNPPSKMSFGFQVWEHNTELSLLTDSRQNFRLWQAKHDKSGLSWKSPIESQWSMCEIEKSLCEIGKSLREITKSPYEKLKLLYENEKMSCEIIITNREWKTAMWDLY